MEDATIVFIKIYTIKAENSGNISNAHNNQSNALNTNWCIQSKKICSKSCMLDGLENWKNILLMAVIPH